MSREPILNPQSIFDEEPVVTTYMGRSTFAVIMACVISFFPIAPIGLFLGAGSNFVVFSDLASTDDEYLGGLVFLIFGTAVFFLVILGMILNKFRNYATNIMGIAYVISFVLGFGLFALLYLAAGPEFLF